MTAPANQRHAEWLRLYVQGAKVPQIAAAFGVQGPAVWRALHKLGVPAANPGRRKTGGRPKRAYSASNASAGRNYVTSPTLSDQELDIRAGEADRLHKEHERRCLDQERQRYGLIRHPKPLSEMPA